MAITKIKNPDCNLDTWRSCKVELVHESISAADILKADLEALVEEQAEALRRAELSRRPSFASLDDRYLAVQSRESKYPNRCLPERRPSQYAHSVNLPILSPRAACATGHPSQEHRGTGRDNSQDSAGIDRLLNAAIATSEKEGPSRALESRRASVASISFPAFPHNIFNSAEEEGSSSGASLSRLPPTPDPLVARKRSPVGYEGLPPMEVVEVL